MTIVTKQDIIQHQVLNDTTGELEVKNFIEQRTAKNLRGGFNMIYHKSYEEVTEAAIKSNNDIKLFNWVTNQFTYARVEVPLIYGDCPVSVSQPTFSRMIKSLVELGYLKRVSRGLYRLNPYIYIPYKADGSELQADWLKLTKDN